MSPLEQATCDELLTELGKRCQSLLVLGVRTDTDEYGEGVPGRHVTMIYTKGGVHAALGLATAARRVLLKQVDF